VGINPRLIDPRGPGTPKLDWRSLEHNKIDRNKLQISALFLTQRPPDDWPDALDHLAIGLVVNKYTKLGKTSEILLVSLGLSYMKIPLC
jgi:hypothetical protein